MLRSLLSLWSCHGLLTVPRPPWRSLAWSFLPHMRYDLRCVCICLRVCFSCFDTEWRNKRKLMPSEVWLPVCLEWVSIWRWMEAPFTGGEKSLEALGYRMKGQRKDAPPVICGGWRALLVLGAGALLQHPSICLWRTAQNNYETEEEWKSSGSHIVGRSHFAELVWTRLGEPEKLQVGSGALTVENPPELQERRLSHN